MSIHIKWISFFNSIQVMSVFGAYAGTSRIGCINMEPNVMGLQELNKWIQYLMNVHSPYEIKNDVFIQP
jgi:hypothetical protein